MAWCRKRTGSRRRRVIGARPVMRLSRPRRAGRCRARSPASRASRARRRRPARRRAECVDALRVALLAGQPDAVDARHPRAGAQVAGERVDARLERGDVAERREVDREQIAWPVLVVVFWSALKSIDVTAHRRAVERAGQQADDQSRDRSPCSRRSAAGSLPPRASGRAAHCPGDRSSSLRASARPLRHAP